MELRWDDFELFCMEIKCVDGLENIIMLRLLLLKYDIVIVGGGKVLLFKCLVVY